MMIKGVSEIGYLNGYKEPVRDKRQRVNNSEIDFAEIFNNELEKLKGVNTVENHENSD